MKLFFTVFMAGAIFIIQARAQTNEISLPETTTNTVETIVCLRHGEKPKGGLGQLDCQGLNRALALPEVLLKKFGPPQFIFAPDPTQKADGNKYFYIRPLATIEPTAIRCGLPVDTEFGFREIKGLEGELEKPVYQNATIFVAWEHGLLDDFARNMAKDHGSDPAQVPDWPGKDFDTIFVFKISRTGGTNAFQFTIDHEGLNNLSTNCP
jgi:hypothetical protein